MIEIEQDDRIQAWRAAILFYLRTVKSKFNLLSWHSSQEYQPIDLAFVADGLFHWWSAIISPNDPGIAQAFSRSEIEAITKYDALIHGFHFEDPNRTLPIEKFITTESFSLLSQGAEKCLDALFLKKQK